MYRDPDPEPAYGASGRRDGYAGAEEPAAYYGGPGDAAEPPAYGGAAEADPYAPLDDPEPAAPAEPVRGPFEPPPGQPRPGEPDDDGLSSDTTPLAQVPGPVRPEAGTAGPHGTDRYDDAGDEPPGEGSHEKMEQIKDLYLTVEAIGDDNVDKHFDELMQRQRELISDYFKETGISTGTSGAAQGGNSSDGT
jgi:hypothetical protein